MRSYEQDLARITMTVASPDRSVRITLGLGGEVDIALADDALRTHSAAEMERQLGAVLRSAVAGREQARRLLREKRRTERREAGA